MEDVAKYRQGGTGEDWLRRMDDLLGPAGAP
jgi:hypothetical protein